MAHGFEPNLGGMLVSCGKSIQQRMRGGIATLSTLGYGLIPNGIFQAARSIEIIAHCIRVDGDMTEMPCTPDLSF